MSCLCRTLFYRKNHGASVNNESSHVPISYEKVPAMAAVIHDFQLLRSLISCLSPPAPMDANVAANPDAPPTGIANRKRSMSTSSEGGHLFDSLTPSLPRSKLLKVTHSPLPLPRSSKLLYVGTNSLDPANVGPNARRSSPQLVGISWNISVAAATILFVSFEHFDHWPALLVKAYADDCFGPKSWIQLEHCQLLVKNLELAHLSESTDVEDAKVLADAQTVMEAYSAIDTMTDLTRPDRTGSPIRMGSFSSHGSSSEAALSRRQRIPTKNQATDDDSSSGDEDEELLMSAHSAGDQSPTKKESASLARPTAADRIPPNGRMPQPIFRFSQLNVPPVIGKLRIRNRYVGANREAAFAAIAASLKDRLDLKAKQNSGLLQCLPAFTTVPEVRSLIAQNLERWLQSPALAGLSRTLFASTVRHFSHVDPPLPADMKAIDAILAMKLKANQVNAHVENVTMIARRIPTVAVVSHMYLSLLRALLHEVNDIHGGIARSPLLQMVGAIHRVIPSAVSYESMAASLLFMLMDRDVQPAHSPDELVTTIRALIRAIALDRQLSFDSFELLKSLLSFEINAETWSLDDEVNRSRLMFQCVTLYADSADTRSQDFLDSWQRIRRLLLGWCCSDYGPRWKEVRRPKEKQGPGRKQPRTSDYRSALDGIDTEERIPSWLNTMRCLLFIEDAASPLMKNYLYPSSTESDRDWSDECERIRKCNGFHSVVDNEMAWIIIKATETDLGTTGMTPEMSVKLLENLFESCSKGRNSSLAIDDPILVWELYNFTEYIPTIDKKRSPPFTDDPERVLSK
jgi:hypothetical protein